jgi:lysophospholipase L1-like esterase
MTVATRLRRLLPSLALAAASLAVLAVLLEIGLRVFWGGYYEKFDPDRPFGEYAVHPVRGLALAPSYERFDWNREFQVWRRHNSLGFRGPEISVETPPGRIRVLVLGDSMTYGVGVEYEETYSAVLESLDPRLQVINTGVPGYCGEQELLVLEEFIERLAPDVVLVAYFWNDLWGPVQGDFRHFEVRDGVLHRLDHDPITEQHPMFARLREKYEERLRGYGFLTYESHLYRFLSDRFKLLGYAIRDLRGEAPEVERGGHIDERQEAAAWELSFALLRAQYDLARAHGVKFAVLVVPDQVQVEPDVEVYEVPRVLWGIQEHVVGFARREGIPVIDPLDTMREIRARKGEPQYHRIDRHWNRVGHRHMGEVLLAELRALGILPPPET